MSSKRFSMPADSISMSAQIADALLKKGNGDAALLYLYLLRHNGTLDTVAVGRALRWKQERLDAALSPLLELGIGEASLPPSADPDQGLSPADYSRKELAEALTDPKNDFCALLSHVESTLGKKLNERELKLLLSMRDSTALPTEVLMMLVESECNEHALKCGDGKKTKLTLDKISKTAHHWKRDGIDTLEAVDDYLNRRDYQRSQEGIMLAAVGIENRKATEKEANFLHHWVDLGFSPEAVKLAAERTLARTTKEGEAKTFSESSFPYCHNILMDWNRRGLHDPQEIERADPFHVTASGNATKAGSAPAKRRVPMAPAPAVPLTDAQKQARERSLEQNQRELQRILDSLPKKKS